MEWIPLVIILYAGLIHIFFKLVELKNQVLTNVTREEGLDKMLKFNFKRNKPDIQDGKKDQLIQQIPTRSGKKSSPVTKVILIKKVNKSL